MTPRVLPLTITVAPGTPALVSSRTRPGHLDVPPPCGAVTDDSRLLAEYTNSGFALNSVTDISPSINTNDRSIILQKSFCIVIVIFPHL